MAYHAISLPLLLNVASHVAGNGNLNAVSDGGVGVAKKNNKVAMNEMMRMGASRTITIKK